jgi:hypothetical protein
MRSTPLSDDGEGKVKRSATTPAAPRSTASIMALVLLRRVVTLGAVESLVEVGVAGLVLAFASVVRPGQDVSPAVTGGQDEYGEQVADFVAGQRDPAVLVTAGFGAPFRASAARVMTRNAVAAMARVMWAYQAS